MSTKELSPRMNRFGASATGRLHVKFELLPLRNIKRVIPNGITLFMY